MLSFLLDYARVSQLFYMPINVYYTQYKCINFKHLLYWSTKRYSRSRRPQLSRGVWGHAPPPPPPTENV